MNSNLPRPRSCLVCGGETTVAHYGIDVCRACTVFYRKSRKKTQYKCKSIAEKCGLNKDGADACKRCRFDRFERILSQTASTSKTSEQPEIVPTNLPDLHSRSCLVCGGQATSAHYGIDACRACTVFYRKARKKKPYECQSLAEKCGLNQDGLSACKRCRFDRFQRLINPSSSASTISEQLEIESPKLPDVPSHIPHSTARPLLHKCAIAYKTLSNTRRNMELIARPNPPHPAKIHSGEYDILPSTYSMMCNSYHALFTGILDMAEFLYPEFTTLSKDDQWKLAVKYCNRIFMFDACYRADQIYPDDMSKAMGTYTAYMSVDVVGRFFDDCPNKCENIDDAKKALERLMVSLPSTRIAVRRANLDKEEFLAVLVLTFWFADCLQMSDQIARIADRFRQEILKELQAHYKEDLKLYDYAARIGELFTIIFNFDLSSQVDENLELYRLLGVFANNTFLYRLQDRPE